MVDIRVLPELITNQIAAGEVVERPVSVVKELMENALDAHATHIVVEVDRGGRDLIRVSDNGDGMSRDNALLSIERYATSKIATTEDLFSIATLGFRGEALPSIASVSKMTITTREQGADYGTRLFLSGGKLMEVSEIGAPPGTVVEIKNLYFNTPVRRKFLKTVSTEMGHIADAFSAMAMGVVGVGFSLIHNGRSVKDVPFDQPLISRVATVLTNDPELKLLPVIFRDDGLEISGYVANPSHTRSGSQRIRIFVNGRMVTDRGVVSAMLQGFRGRLMKGRFPVAVLFFTLPFEGVDVNVHPAKLQVRFVNEKNIYHAVRQSVQNALERAENKILDANKEGERKDDDLSANKSVSLANQSPADPEKISSSDNDNIARFKASSGDGGSVREDVKGEVVGKKTPAAGLFQWGPTGNDVACGDGSQALNWNRKQIIGKSNLPFGTIPGDCKRDDTLCNAQISESESVEPKADHVQNFQSDDGCCDFDSNFENPSSLDANDVEKKITGEADLPVGKEVVPSDFSIVGQVMGTYIIVENSGGIELIDQHAAHERIMYEQLKRRSKKFKPPSQQLIVPHMLNFNFSQSALFERIIPALSQLGFDIEPFGERAYAVKSVPAIIGVKDVETLLNDMVENTMESGFESDDDGIDKSGWLDDCLILMACHHSVRANQKLTEKEMVQLVRDLDECENAFYCPHGRPIRIAWSQKDFDRMFRRVV